MAYIFLSIRKSRLDLRNPTICPLLISRLHVPGYIINRVNIVYYVYDILKQQYRKKVGNLLKMPMKFKLISMELATNRCTVPLMIPMMAECMQEIHSYELSK